MSKNINYNISELLDKLSVLQIKQIVNNTNYKKYQFAIDQILRELDMNILKNQKITLNSKIIKLLIALAQINYHIWIMRDKTKKGGAKYKENIKISHLLNALRNITKNKLLYYLTDNRNKDVRTNINIEDLKNWKFGILNEK